MAVALQGPMGRANAARRADAFRFVPDTRFVKVLAFGHQSTAADVVWLGSLPNMSRSTDDPERRERKRKWLDGVLKTVRELEPTFTTVYVYGSDYLWLANREYQKAIDLLQRGVSAEPDNTLLLVKLGMAYFHNKQRDRALHYLRLATLRPDCDSLTLSMYAALQVDDRQDEAALRVFLPLIESAPNALMKELAERDFEIVRKKIVIRARDEFEQRHGRKPASLDDLREPGLVEDGIRDVVIEDKGVRCRTDGTLEFPRLDELEVAHTMRGINSWCDAYYNEHGEFPTLEQMISNPWFAAGAPPRGKRWAWKNRRFCLEDDPDAGAEVPDGSGGD